MTDLLGAQPAAPPEIDLDGGATLLRWLEQMRDEHPVWTDPAGKVHVFRHEDVMGILADPRTFSSDLTGRLSGGEHSAPDGLLLLLDPPLHGVMRRLVSKVFTPRTIDALAPQITEVAANLLADLDGVAGFDAVTDFASPFPVIVIASMLGIPVEDRPMFQRWADALLETDYSTPDGPAALAALQEEMTIYLGEHVRDRRAHERDDLVGRLVRAEVDGRRLEDDDVITFAALLLLAGHVTSAVLLSNMLLELDADPALTERLGADRTLIPAFTDEVLRLRPPFLKVERLPTRPVEVAGVELAENTHLHLWLMSANRDPSVFTEPDRFDLERPNARQLAFGHGIHHCLGAPLARLESRIALDLILDGYPGLRPTAGERISFHPNRTNVFGPRRLPVRGAAAG